MRVAHGSHNRRVSEQLLNCHYIYASIHETGCERMTELMPRHAFDPGLSACESKICIEINKRLSGFVVVEDECVRPTFPRSP